MATDRPTGVCGRSCAAEHRDQLLAADAAYVVIAATALDALDDRTYRDAQLAAGLVEGRLHLAACALGASVSGMTFLDSEVPALRAAASAAPPRSVLSRMRANLRRCSRATIGLYKFSVDNFKSLV